MEILDLLVLAAGRGSRMGEATPKPFLLLGKQPVIVYCLQVFESLPYIGTKYVVCSPGDMTRMTEVLTEYLISNFGWRSAYLVLSAVALVGIVPQGVLLVAWPSDLGLKVDGARVGSAAGPAAPPRRGRRLVVVDEKWANYPWTLGAALRTSRFWMLSGNLLLGVMTNQMLWAHEAAYLVDVGLDKMVAASLVGLSGFGSIPGKILWGVATDRLGRELTYGLGMVCMVGAILLMSLLGIVPSVWLAALFALAFSAGYAVGAPLTPAAAADIFAGRWFGAIYGLMNVGMGLGGALGSWLAGYAYDTTGSYLAALAAAAFASSASAVCMWLAAPRHVRRVVRVG